MFLTVKYFMIWSKVWATHVKRISINYNLCSMTLRQRMVDGYKVTHIYILRPLYITLTEYLICFSCNVYNNKIEFSFLNIHMHVIIMSSLIWYTCINNTSISVGLFLRPFYGIINDHNPTLCFWAVIYCSKSIFPPSVFKDLRC